MAIKSPFPSESHQDSADQADSAMFGHPDDTSYLDSLEDAVRDVANLQTLGPIVRGESLNAGLMMKFGDIEFANILTPPQSIETGVFAAVTWDAGRAVYMNPAIFSSRANESTGKHWGHNISEMDPPEHTKYRSHMQRGFMPKLVASWEESIIQPVLTRHFDAIKKKGRADLVRELTAYFPYEVVSTVVGFNASDMEFVASALKRMHQGLVNPAAALQASQEIKAYSKKLIDERRRAPKDDLVSAMTRAEVDDALIPDDTFVGMVIHLMQGGIDTVYRLSSNMIHLLLSHPDQFELLKANRTLIPNVVEEALRYEGVASMMPRLVIEDTELMGTHLPKGSIIWVMQAAINRDPARWTNPHTFDITRERIANMAFGNGAHSCIGMHLARVEVGHFLEHVLDDLPNLRWDPDLNKIPKITGWQMRGACSLPVVWGVPN